MIHLTQLDKIIDDLTYVDLTDTYEMEWLAERIAIREQHGTHSINRCDGCPSQGMCPIIIIVDDYPDDMGAPSTLGVSYVCRYHVNQN